MRNASSIPRNTYPARAAGVSKGWSENVQRYAIVIVPFELTTIFIGARGVDAGPCTTAPFCAGLKTEPWQGHSSMWLCEL